MFDQHTKLRQFSAGEIPSVDVIISSIELSKEFHSPTYALQSDKLNV